MSRFRSVVVLGAIALLGFVTACSDVTGPEQQKSGFCPLSGGPGTCDGH